MQQSLVWDHGSVTNLSWIQFVNDRLEKHICGAQEFDESIIIAIDTDALRLCITRLKCSTGWNDPGSVMQEVLTTSSSVYSRLRHQVRVLVLVATTLSVLPVVAFESKWHDLMGKRKEKILSSSSILPFTSLLDVEIWTETDIALKKHTVSRDKAPVAVSRLSTGLRG